jgi:hypothetical protein
MAHKIENFNLPLRAASAIGQYMPVRFVGDGVTPGSALSETVVRAGSINEDVLGMTLATVAAGQEVAVAFIGESKGIAGASLGAGARLAVGSTNGVLIPILPSGGPATVNAIVLRFTVGRSLRNAAAGDIFAFVLDPQQIT